MRTLETRTDGTYLRLAPHDFAREEALPKFIEDWIAQGFKISAATLPVNAEGGYIHPTANIASGVNVHPSALVGVGAQVTVDLPENSVVGDYARTGPCREFGRGIIIGPGTQLKLRQKIGERVFIGPDNILDENFATEEPWEKIIADNVIIGTRNIITSIDVLGRDAIVGQHNEIVETSDGAGFHLGYKGQIADKCFFIGNIFVSNGCRVGARTQLGAGVIIKSDSRIGEDVIIGAKTTLDGRVTVNNKVKIGIDCFVGARTILEPEVHIEDRSGVERDCVIGTKTLVKSGMMVNVGQTINARAIVDSPKGWEKE